MSNRAARRAAERQAQKAHVKSGVMPPSVLPGIFEVEAITQPTPHATESQIAANQANAKLSTGPITPEGKAAVSQNRRTHGLAGCFHCLPDEDPDAFRELTESVYAEYEPTTDTEKRLAESLIQHYWRMQRAIRLQENIFLDAGSNPDAKKLSLFMRYQTTHERSYYKAQRELQNLQKQKRKEQIGFESQTRMQEAHEARTRLANAKAETLEVNAACRPSIEAPMPGHTKVPLDQIIHACSTAIASLVHEEQFKASA